MEFPNRIQFQFDITRINFESNKLLQEMKSLFFLFGVWFVALLSGIYISWHLIFFVWTFNLTHLDVVSLFST